MPERKEGDSLFLLERYRADRAHELEVEKFSAQFETAFFQTSALLNGAFAAGFLAFYGTTIDKLTTYKLLVVISFACWMFGLLLAISAGYFAYSAQQNIVSMLRNRRHERGMLTLGENYPHLLGSLSQRPLDELRRLAADQDRKSGRGMKCSRFLGFASLCLAMCGGLSALATIWCSTEVAQPF